MKAYNKKLVSCPNYGLQKISEFICMNIFEYFQKSYRRKTNKNVHRRQKVRKNHQKRPKMQTHPTQQLRRVRRKTKGNYRLHIINRMVSIQKWPLRQSSLSKMVPRIHLLQKNCQMFLQYQLIRRRQHRHKSMVCPFLVIYRFLPINFLNIIVKWKRN